MNYDNFDEPVTQIPAKDCDNQPHTYVCLPASRLTKSVFDKPPLTADQICFRIGQLVGMPALTDTVMDELLHWLAVYALNWPGAFRQFVKCVLADQTPEDRAKWEHWISKELPAAVGDAFDTDLETTLAGLGKQ